jgi:hypothetical protein
MPARSADVHPPTSDADLGRETHWTSGGRPIERFAELRGLLVFRVTELRAAQEARATVEERYLAGHTALFPDTVKAWDEQCRAPRRSRMSPAAWLRSMVSRRQSRPAPMRWRRERPSSSLDLVEPAKTTALGKLGEGERAQGIAIGWLRPKFGLVGVVTNLAS